MSLRGSRRPRGRRRCPSSTASATAAMPLRTRSSALCPPPTSGAAEHRRGISRQGFVQNRLPVLHRHLRDAPRCCRSHGGQGHSRAGNRRVLLCAHAGHLDACFRSLDAREDREIYRHDGSGYRPRNTRRERAPHEPAHVSAHSGVHHRADIPADVQQQRTAHCESPRRGRLRRLRAVLEEVPRAGHRDAGRQARLGQGQARDVSRLSASMSEICIPSVDKGKHGFGGQKCAHTSSKSLTIQQVFSAAFSSSGHISAPSKLLRT